MITNLFAMRGKRKKNAFLSCDEMSNYLRRGRKTSRDQVEMYVRFLEKNPTEAVTRSNPTNNKRIHLLWEHLALQLNASEQGPLKSVLQWQETFANWRYQLRFKTRKLIQQQEEGLDLMELSDLEERALRVFTKSTTFENEQEQRTSPKVQSKRVTRRNFSRKRSLRSISPQYRRITRNSTSVDSTSQIFEEQPDCETNSFLDFLEHEEKPIVDQDINETPQTTSSASQTDNDASENVATVSSSNSKADLQTEAINKLEKAVNSLNNTLKHLVQVQSDMLSIMNRR